MSALISQCKKRGNGLLFQRLKTLFLEDDPDTAGRRDIKCLNRILSVTDITALDPNILEHCPEDVCAHLSVGHTDSNKCTARLQILDSLSVTSPVGSGNHSGGRTVTTSRSFDVGYNILGSLKVDPSVSTERLDELLLDSAGINSDDPEAHCLRILDGKMTKTTTSAGKSYPVINLSVGDLESLVCGNTSAENGSGACRIKGFGDRGNVVDERDDVLGESTVGSVTRKLDIGTVCNGQSVLSALDVSE